MRPNTNQHASVGRPGVTGRPEAREGPDVRCLSDVRNFGLGVLWSDVRASSVFRGAPEIRRFGSGAGASVVRRGPDVRSLDVIGRLGFVSRPEPGDFEQFFFLSRELGVITVLSVKCSRSVAFLQAPDHT